MADKTCDIAVVGAGLSGLACAQRLTRAGLDVRVIEASDAVGGRVRTDRVDGFRLDRGFQVLNTAYPELTAQVDLDQLDLRHFNRAMLLHVNGETVRLEDPRRKPREIFTAARSPIGGMRDKAAFAAYAGFVAYAPESVLRRQKDRPAAERWGRFGMSQMIIDRCLRPFFSGLLLETDMSTSSRFTDLMMRRFIRGSAAVPAAGMQALPDLLAHNLTVELQRSAITVRPTEVETSDGRIRSNAVVVATPADEAAKLLSGLRVPQWRGVSTVYYAADDSPLNEPTLIVDAEHSPVNNTVVMTEAAPSYSADGRALIATSVVHEPGKDPKDIDDAVIRSHLARLYQCNTAQWEHVATYDIPRALPAMPAPHPFVRSTQENGVYICGDHRDTSSIQGALVSGRRVADSILCNLGVS